MEDVDRRKNVTCRFSVCFYALRSEKAPKHLPRWSRFTTSHAYLCRSHRYQNWLFSISCFKPRDNYVFIFNFFVLPSFVFFNSFFIAFLTCSYFQRLFLWFVVQLLLSSFIPCFVLSFLPFSKFLLSYLWPLEFCLFSLKFRTFSCCRISIGPFYLSFIPCFVLSVLPLSELFLFSYSLSSFVSVHFYS